MKILLLLAILSGCSVNTSSNIDIDVKDIKYVKDNERDLCFAFVASEKSFETEASGLGMTEVPCEKAFPQR